MSLKLYDLKTTFKNKNGKRINTIIKVNMVIVCIKNIII